MLVQVRGSVGSKGVLRSERVTGFSGKAMAILAILGTAVGSRAAEGMGTLKGIMIGFPTTWEGPRGV